ncbi:uncharacterized protein LOC135106714 [Scylla paramamosain]|uniref:uncharacterized protein LOC135106714 n=1 Tax=Scylla paramamosain TaxID=85552 RepID=UPI00308299CC
MGSAVEQLPVYVADLDEPCLLGLDYLMQSKAYVDLGRKLVRVRGQEVPLLLEVSCAEVVVAERVHLAPRTEARVRCRLSRAMHGSEGIVEPTENLQLADGVALGTCEEVEHPEETSGSAEVAAVRPLPDFLEDLAHWSATNLMEVQMEKVHHTLAQYADVFSRGDMDLDRTGLVKHIINTGSSAPIKSPPHRITPARREEMQHTINELAVQGLIEQSESVVISSSPG